MRRDIVRLTVWSAVAVAVAVWFVIALTLHTPPDPALRCVLTPGSHEFRSRGPVLRFNVRLDNQTGRAIHLPEAINGSDCGNGSRYPHCLYQVYLPHGQAMSWQPFQMPLDYASRFVEPGDFHEVPPGGAFNPFSPEDPTAIGIAPFRRDLPPGDYRVRFVYRTNPPREEQWYSYWPSLGEKPNPSDELLRLIRDTPSGEFISNEVTLTVPVIPQSASIPP